MDRGIPVSSTADVYSRQQTLRLGPAMQVIGTGVPQRTLVTCSQLTFSICCQNDKEQQAPASVTEHLHVSVCRGWFCGMGRGERSFAFNEGGLVTEF